MPTVERWGPYHHDLKNKPLKKGDFHGTWYGPDDRLSEATVVAAAFGTDNHDTYVKVRDVIYKHRVIRDGDLFLRSASVGINVENLGEELLNGYTLYLDVIHD